MLGKGAFGKVYCIRANIRGEIKMYSVKIQRTEIGVVDYFVNSCIENESRILARLDHPFVVRMLKSYTGNTYNFMFTELVEGLNLQVLSMKYRRLSVDLVKNVCSQVVMALEYIHEMGIIYGDLKPENIMLDKKGRIRLLDFGTAVDTDTDEEFADYQKQTRGTLNYVAPEYLLGTLD